MNRRFSKKWLRSVLRCRSANVSAVVAFVVGVILAGGVNETGGSPALSAEPSEKSDRSAELTFGTFLRFKDGALTLKGKSGVLVIENVDKTYKAYTNNENGPGSKLVEVPAAFTNLAPGTLVQLNREQREIVMGIDHRVIGKFESYRDGTLRLGLPDLKPGYVHTPGENRERKIGADVPVLESTNGADYRYVGQAGKVLPNVKAGTTVVARGEFDPSVVEVVQLGDPRRTIERYIGQTRGTVRGEFVSFKNGLLRIRGKGLSTLAANEYERIITGRIPEGSPIVESIDGAEYKPASLDALASLKEGTTVTIRKVEEVLIEVQIGLPRKK